MRYLIIHTGRTGSNHLCDLLAQTGVAGIVDVWTCGFFIGLKNHIADNYHAHLQQYLEKHTTPNGVFGAKAGMQYFAEMKREVGLPETMRFLNSIDKFIWLRRYDKHAQAVSTFIASATKRWHSRSETNRPDPAYDRDSLNWCLMDILMEEARAQAFFKMYDIVPLQIFYEDLVAAPDRTITSILDFLDIPVPRVEFKPTFTRLNNPLKQEFLRKWRGTS